MLKGQHLFVRLAGPSDLEELRNFYQSEQPDLYAAGTTQSVDDREDQTESLIGKLVGDLVAHCRFLRTGDAVTLRSIYVARLLRRKRIGRFMIAELARVAGRGGAARIVAPAGCDAASFLRACGFETSDDEESLTMEINLEEEL